MLEIFGSEGLSLAAMALSAFLSSTLLPGGSEVLLVALVAEGKSDPSTLILVAGIANTAGGLVTYWMGYWAERGLAGRLRWRQNPHQPDSRALSWIKRWGYLALLLSWLPVVGDGLCLAAGWLKIRWLPSAIAIFVGKTTRYAVLAYLYLHAAA